jgi:hypothetical protein
MTVHKILDGWFLDKRFQEYDGTYGHQDNAMLALGMMIIHYTPCAVSVK